MYFGDLQAVIILHSCYCYLTLEVHTFAAAKNIWVNIVSEFTSNNVVISEKILSYEEKIYI